VLRKSRHCWFSHSRNTRRRYNRWLWSRTPSPGLARNGAPAILGFLKRARNRRSREPGVRGGIKGSWPVGGDYGAYEVLNWASKFFADALMRHEAIETTRLGAPSTLSVLA